MEVKDYFRNKEHYTIEGQPRVSVLQLPGHGTLVDEGEGYFAYYPEKATSAMTAPACWLKWAVKKSRWNISSA